MEYARFDEIDNEIISILTEDARTPFRVMQDKLGVSIGTIHNRIKKLERSRVIEGYTLKKFEKAKLTPLECIGAIYNEIRKLTESSDNYTLKGFTEKLAEIIAQIPKYITKRGLEVK